MLLFHAFAAVSLRVIVQLGRYMFGDFFISFLLLPLVFDESN